MLRVLAALPNTSEIWDKVRPNVLSLPRRDFAKADTLLCVAFQQVIYFIHQMVTAINSQLIPFIPQTITLLLANAKDPKQFLDFTSLLNQWVTKYKVRACLSNQEQRTAVAYISPPLPLCSSRTRYSPSSTNPSYSWRKRSSPSLASV